MKSLLALGLLVAVAPASAQYNMRVGSLGGGLASRTISRPLGGITPGVTGANRNFRTGAPRAPLYAGYPYAYSVWVPDYFDYLSAASQYGPATTDAYGYYGPLPNAPAAPQQPVVINQYFGAPPPQQPPVQESSTTASTQAPGDPIGSPQNYYLIAYKDHAVYSALAYWLEDKTLHYVTTENKHNQASLDLIDLALTKSLNQRNEVPFSIPGQ